MCNGRFPESVGQYTTHIWYKHFFRIMQTCEMNLWYWLYFLFFFVFGHLKAFRSHFIFPTPNNNRQLLRMGNIKLSLIKTFIFGVNFSFWDFFLNVSCHRCSKLQQTVASASVKCVYINMDKVTCVPLCKLLDGWSVVMCDNLMVVVSDEIYVAKIYFGLWFGQVV